MARIGAPSLYTLLIIYSSFLLVSQIHAGRSLERRKLERAPITMEGLLYDYYAQSCPSAETIVRKYLEQLFAEESAIGPGILRLFFHDCFSSGCDASILLHRQGGELSTRDNQGFRPYVLDTIEVLRGLIRTECLRVVSCSDVLILAAREAVRQYGGPDFDVPLGRKDSLTFNLSYVLNLPSVDQYAGEQLELYAEKNLDATDLVALSGAHTYGVTHCGGVHNRTQDPRSPIEPEFKKTILARCRNLTTEVPYINLDMRTPYKFDNMYYIDLLNNQGVLTSDQDLAVDPRTKEIVNSFASDEELFFEKFANAFVKVSQLNVLTGNDGEIRKSCFATNKEESSQEDDDELVKEI